MSSTRDERQLNLAEPDPILWFPIPGMDAHYRIRSTSIIGVYEDDDYGRCKILLSRSEAPVLVNVSHQTVLDHVPHLTKLKSPVGRTSRRG